LSSETKSVGAREGFVSEPFPGLVLFVRIASRHRIYSHLHFVYLYARNRVVRHVKFSVERRKLLVGLLVKDSAFLVRQAQLKFAGLLASEVFDLPHNSPFSGLKVRSVFIARLLYRLLSCG
jgi:hypothetical protein